MSRKATAGQLALTFAEVRRILKPYAGKLVIQIEQTGNYTAALPRDRASLVFSLIAARTQITFDFFPLYAFPDLLKDLSPKLAKHMVSRTGWAFKQPDENLFQELAAVIDAGFRRYEAAGLL